MAKSTLTHSKSTSKKVSRSLSHVDFQAPSQISIPALRNSTVELRFAHIQDRDSLLPVDWQHIALTPDESGCWYSVDISAHNLSDGEYEYEFVINNNTNEPIADPFAVEITRFGGYRGIMRIKNGKKVPLKFNWKNELTRNKPLPGNHELVIYELPMRWTSTESEMQERQVGLGTFDNVIFEHLNTIASDGFNAIELLPVQDSSDTLNWGYGTRFFYAPDLDMGGPLELKVFIKRCHQSGIRVILDVVMNHARGCPLEKLAKDYYFLNEPGDEGREHDWGGTCFRVASPAPDDVYMAREFLYDMAKFWITEYHIDGFRIDEFKGIKNWDFLQDFTKNAWEVHDTNFKERPFIVIAEDSARRARITKDNAHRNNRILDAMWDFNQRDDLRRAISNKVDTRWGEPSRIERVEATIRGHRSWNDLHHNFHEGFDDMAQRIVYLTSHDTGNLGEQRLMNYLMREELEAQGWSDFEYVNIRNVVDEYDGYTGDDAVIALNASFERARSAYCLLMTSVGIPMILAGEEFGDVHDTNYRNWKHKMSDVISWPRRNKMKHSQLSSQISELINLRKGHPALLRNEVEFFYFHPGFNENNGERVFAFCRTGGKELYSSEQVVVIANLSRYNYHSFVLPWHWQYCQEQAVSTQGESVSFSWQQADIPLMPGQVRVFTT